MRTQTIAPLLLLTVTLCVPVAFAQNDAPPMPAPEPTHDISDVEEAQFGGTNGIPVPEGSDALKLEIPELAGAELLLGPVLIDGRLPRPFVDYHLQVEKLSQRITLFEQGIVAVRIVGPEGLIQKKLRIPKDAFETLEKEIRVDDLQAISPTALHGSTSGVATLRIYRPDGTHVERRFDPSFTLPPTMQTPRLLLEDLLRAIAEDREVTNSLSGYLPAVGDRLVGEDQKTYEVVAVLQNGMVQLTGLNEPVTTWVQVNDIPKYFIGKRRSDSR